MDVKEFLFSLSSPNAFGEAIRDYAFVKNDPREYGCYTSFDLIGAFKPIGKGSDRGRRLLFTMGLQEDDPECESVTMAEAGDFTVAWYWDGDGTLLVGCGDKFAINDDCKKDYCWHWTRLSVLP